jgi:hypothetical protein
MEKSIGATAHYQSFPCVLLDFIRKDGMDQSDFFRITRDEPMASPAELMQTVSAATGVPLATITDLDRRLVKAGLRRKGGRGLNAARMTPVDAARLLSAVLASPQANEAAEAVERYIDTRVDQQRSSEKLFAAAEIGELTALPVRHSFVDGLAALIASTSTGALARLIAASGNRWIPRLEVFAFTGVARGRIRITGLPNGLTANVEYARDTAGIRSGRTRKPGDADASGDLEQSRRVTERTILPIAKLLAAESLK